MSRPSPQGWRTISKLLDEVLDLPDEARPAWLAALAARAPESARAIESWLEEYAVMNARGFLDDRPAGPAPAVPLAGVAVGAYRLVEPIGQGGMGTVWLAERRDGPFDQRVAVKLLNAALMDAAGTDRFAREAGILARLTHPSISRLLDAGVSAIGAPYLVLEHVTGLAIDRYCDAHALPLRERLYLFLDVLAPVAHAHANLIVHRDLKPANVLVTPERHVKLLDFGIAKLLPASPDGSTVPVTKDNALTPAYAAPEQLTGGSITTATDVYALGVLLYQLVSGRHPSVQGATTPAGLIDAVVNREPLAPADMLRQPAADGEPTAEAIAAARGTTLPRLRADLSSDLETILAKALKKAPAERYATVGALEDDLRRYLRHQPIAARPDTIRYRAARFARRHRAPVALAALAVLALVAGLAGTISQARRATAQARRADEQALEVTTQRDFARRQLARAEAINDLNAFLIADAAPAGERFTARDLLERAAQIVTRQGDDADGSRIESLTSIGSIYANIGETSRATALLQQAYDAAAGSTDPALRARASCALGRGLVKTGDIARARQLVADGLAALPDRPEFGLTRATCLLDASSTAMWAGDGEGAVADVTEARRAVEAGGVLSPLMSLRIAMQLAEALRMADRGVEANTAFAAAYDQLVALGRQDTERAGTLLNNWGLLLGALGRPRDSERMLRRSIDVSLAGGSDARVEPISWANLARPLYDLGRYAEAVTFAERAMRMARERGDSVVADQAQLMTARASILAGQFDRAQALLDDVDTRFRAMFPPSHAAFNALAMDRVRLALERGDLAAATRLADDAVRLMDSDPKHRPSLPLALRHRAMVHLKAGRYADALGDAERLLPLVRANVPEGTRSSALGIAYITLGEALAGLDRAAEAKTALAEALRHLDDAAGPTHPGTVRARALLGRL